MKNTQVPEFEIKEFLDLENTILISNLLDSVNLLIEKYNKIEIRLNMIEERLSVLNTE